MPEELIPINIVIGDRTYRLRSSPEEEGVIRNNVKTINDKIVEFKTQFAGKDMQDYIAMVMIWYATELSGNNDPAAEKTVIEALERMEQQIDKVITP